MCTTRLRISELYRSIQGEGLASGLPCTFVRLTGCDLRCRWCDTEYAFHGGSWMEIDAIIERVRELGTDLVLITGGEPLLQESVTELARRLLDDGARVLVETGGHRALDALDRRTEIIMDLKCPTSGECEHNLWDNLLLLKPEDQLKLVIADRDDYTWARSTITERGLSQRHTVILTPVHGELDAETLAAWILEDRLEVRLGLQLHKVIWPADRRGV